MLNADENRKQFSPEKQEQEPERDLNPPVIAGYSTST